MMRCIAAAAKNIDGPNNLIIINSGQGFVVCITNADIASQIATEFHTTIAVQTRRPVFFKSRNAINSPVIPITASPAKGINHAGGGSPKLAPPTREMNASVMARPHNIKVKISIIFWFILSSMSNDL